ncbi:MAG: hypothetical protein R3F54_02285 [Alphaproteobacteria bacterium]
MVLFRSAALTLAVLAGTTLAAPLGAQTSATLGVSARVIEECTAQSKRELVRLARKLNDPSLISRCSKSVSSQVNLQVVNVASLQPRVALPPQISQKRLGLSTIKGQADVFLVTVSY